MRSLADLGRVSALLQRRAARLREQAARESTAAAVAEAEARELLEQCAFETSAARLHEEEGLSRNVLFERLRAIAVSRAHVMERKLKHAELVSQAADHRSLQEELLVDASGHASRARRLEEVHRKFSDMRKHRRLRRVEIETQENVRWK